MCIPPPILTKFLWLIKDIKFLICANLFFYRSNNVTVNASSPTVPKNIYLYESHNLVLSYALAISAAAIAVIFGTVAFFLNGVGYESTVSTFAVTMQNPEVNLFALLLNHIS